MFVVVTTLGALDTAPAISSKPVLSKQIIESGEGYVKLFVTESNVVTLMVVEPVVTVVLELAPPAAVVVTAAAARVRSDVAAAELTPAPLLGVLENTGIEASGCSSDKQG